MNETLKQESKIGQKYIIHYSDLYPQYEFTDRNSVSPLVKKYMKEIEKYTSIIEYLGNGLYKDLATGKLILDDNRKKRQSEDIKYLMTFNTKLEKTNKKIELKKEEKEKIKYYYDLAEYIQINELLKKKEVFTKEDIKKIEEYRHKLNIERSGEKYIVKYSDLKLTLDHKDENNYQKDYNSYLNSNSKPNYIGNNLTIIQFITDDLYIDLTSGLIITQNKIEPFFHKENDRIDYSKIYNEIYLLQYPIRIDIKDIKPIDDETMYLIGKETIPIAEKIKEYILKTKDDIQKESLKIIEEIKLKEFERQYEEAIKLYEKEKTIQKVKRYYNIR